MYGVVTWFYFDETGYITDSGNNCGNTTLSQCFTYQLNTNTSPTTQGDFNQAIMYSDYHTVYWNDFIGCNNTSCNYYGVGTTYSPTWSNSYFNNTNNVFVLAINAGSSSIGWGVTSCNTQFTESGYTFQYFVLNLSTCSSSKSYYETPGATYFTGNKYTLSESVGVGWGGGSNSTFKHTQVTGELFNQNVGYYSGTTSTLTAEGSNMVDHFGTFGSVVPICYHSPDVSAPC